MDVERNTISKRSMYGKERPTDSFHCPNVGKEGHHAKLLKRFPEWRRY
jgi:hypothetical protein